MLFFTTACKKDLTSLNIETKKPAAVPAGPLFASATRQFADNMASASVNTNPWRFAVKHWAMTTYNDEVQFDYSTRNIPQTWWLFLYRDVLLDYKSAAKIISESTTLLPGVKANQLAMVDIMQLYVYSVMVNTFDFESNNGGSIPSLSNLRSKN